LALFWCGMSQLKEDVGCVTVDQHFRDFQKIKSSTKVWYTVPQNSLGGSMLELTAEIKSLLLNTAQELNLLSASTPHYPFILSLEYNESIEIPAYSTLPYIHVPL
jgi:hypothetical protein